jgi:hypothetical protein
MTQICCIPMNQANASHNHRDLREATAVPTQSRRRHD